MTKHNLHRDSQFGYKKHHSTETMLLNLINEILRGFDEDQCTIIMFLNLSVPFDTIDIELLISILRDEIGVSGLALCWITSFLTGCTQNVSIGSCYSDNQNVDCGVPQGSILGPQFFNVYVRSQPKSFLQCSYKSCPFTDDSSGRKRFSDLPIQYLKTQYCFLHGQCKEMDECA